MKCSYSLMEVAPVLNSFIEVFLQCNWFLLNDSFCLGTLTVLVKDLKTLVETSVFSLSGDQLKDWHTQKVPVSATNQYKVIITNFYLFRISKKYIGPKCPAKRFSVSNLVIYLQYSSK